MIICLVQDRSAVAGWILDVSRGRMGVAHKGQGVAIDGAPVRGRPPDRPLIGFVGPKARKEFDRQLSPAARQQLGHMSASSCAGLEYLDILSGQVDFSLYRTTKSWDHAAGTLMLAEAGGGSVRFDGQPYTPAQPINAGLIAAADLQTLAQVRALFEAVRLPLLAGLPAT
jgi:fructose-1,6-bisphosphatase/inositol monophosphatase family enzyme